MTEEDGPRGIVTDADTAYEAIRAINHATIWSGGIPAPTIYSVLGNLKTAIGFGTEQALGQLADRLVDSLDEYDVIEDSGGNPAESVAAAVDHLRAAAALAGQIGNHVSAAQNAIAGQGHRGRIDAGRS
ncbi:hypothetical protein [Gryllotalpicola protaetiae]|uniref:Uncharacterized protein n=1 Tax=Gryllotalpicola protaetiae TaxID=2419771 RepID=A0A387BZX1_9MICO|nr:hypothetical protein [Gryllotalpicola protaetiae]AYG03881.1 hypothetical protein D7I44_10265 [Gryllotalpicola protaetiae]